MSYSLNDNCFNCRFKDECSDKEMIESGINQIHQTTYDDGHKGGGNIIIHCQNHDQACPDQEATADAGSGD